MAPSPEPQPSPRRWFTTIAVWVIVGAVISLGAIVWHIAAEERVARKIEADQRWLELTIIPTINWQQVTLEEAVAELNRLIEQTPGHSFGLRIIIASEEEARSSFRRVILHLPGAPEIPGLEQVPAETRTFDPSKNDTIENPIETRLSNIPVSEALRYTAGLTGREWIIERRGILLYPNAQWKGTYAPFVSRTFRVRKDLLSRSIGEPDFRDATTFLATNGVIFYEGCSADFDSERGKLRVVLPQE